MAENVTGTVEDVIEGVAGGSESGGIGEIVEGVIDQVSAGGSDGTVPGIDSVLGVMEGIVNDTEYTNMIASAVSSLGNVLGSFLPGSLGEMAQQLFKSIADKIDKCMYPNEDIREQERKMLAGGEISDVAKEVSDVVGMDASAFNDDLSAAAEMLSSGSIGDGSPNAVMEIGAAISGSVQAYPLATGTALQTYSDVSCAWLAEHGDEFPDADANVRAVNNAMANYYFESVMQAEANGLALSEEDRQALSEFHMYGVETTYEQYVEEHQEEFEAMKSESLVVRSDGSLEAQTEARTDEARSLAVSDAGSGALADHREDMDAREEWESKSADAVAEIREAGPEGMGDAYIAKLAEMQAYNDAAVSAITEKYANDPEGKLAAEAGLAMRMQAGMGPLFDAMKQDQEAYGCFSAEQLEQIAGVQVTGVAVDYESYVPGTGLYPSDIQAGEDDGLYANALPLDENGHPENVMLSGTDVAASYAGVQTTAPQAPAAQVNGMSYGEMAETTLGTGNISSGKEKEAEYGK